MPEEVVLVEKKDCICTVTINRPERRNALNPEVVNRLVDIFKSVGDDGQTHVVVLRGAGQQSFSAGFDLGAGMPGAESSNLLDAASSAIESCPCPVLAMVYGHAMGGGLGLALSCDLRLAAENARMGIPAVRLGIMYSAEGIQRCINVLGLPVTKRLLLTGTPVDAATACSLGLADRVSPVDQLYQDTYALAREMAQNAPLSVRATKIAIDMIVRSKGTDPSVRAQVVALRSRICRSEDAQEGQRAFADKRRPVFKGK